jgi:hypothetical protein
VIASRPERQPLGQVPPLVVAVMGLLVLGPERSRSVASCPERQLLWQVPPRKEALHVSRASTARASTTAVNHYSIIILRSYCLDRKHLVKSKQLSWTSAEVRLKPCCVWHAYASQAPPHHQA